MVKIEQMVGKLTKRIALFKSEAITHIKEKKDSFNIIDSYSISKGQKAKM